MPQPLPNPSLTQNQIQVQPQPQPQISQDPSLTAQNPLWGTIGQYGVGAAALLTVLKAWNDYQLKSAQENRALRNKESNQAIEREERIYGSVISQNETLSTNQGNLLNTFIAKALNQAEITNEQITELIRTITTLTDAIRTLSDSQHQQIEMLHEIKEAVESLNGTDQCITQSLHDALETLALQTNLINQVLASSEVVVAACSVTQPPSHRT